MRRVCRVEHAPPPVATRAASSAARGAGVALHLAESGLALLREDRGDRLPGGPLDPIVSVHERPAEPRRTICPTVVLPRMTRPARYCAAR